MENSYECGVWNDGTRTNAIKTAIMQCRVLKQFAGPGCVSHTFAILTAEATDGAALTREETARVRVNGATARTARRNAFMMPMEMNMAQH